MKISRRVLAGVFAASLAFAAFAQEKLLVQVPAVIDPALAAGKIPHDNRNACDTPRRLAEQVFKNVAARFPQAVGHPDPATAAGEARHLRLLITGLDGWGDANEATTAGIPSVTVQADVYQGSKLIASKQIRRRSVDGAPGSCDARDKIARVLGKDVADWLPIAMAVPTQTR